MKEKIKVKLTCFDNGSRGPNFKIYCNNDILDIQENYMEKTLVIEHYGKRPKDTLVNKNLDVAIRLEELSFNGIKCSLVDLHDNIFFTSNWPHPVEKQIKNNLYFGYNGAYKYFFKSPSLTYILGQRKKHQKEMRNLDKINVTEEEFIKILEKNFKN
jgi:hypothetical protein